MGAGLYRREDAGDFQSARFTILFPVRRAVGPLLAASLLVFGALPAIAAAPSGGVTVAVGRSHTQGSTGTTCTSAVDQNYRRTSSCDDVAYPLAMHGSVTLRPRRRLRMVFTRRVATVAIILRLKRAAGSRSVYSARAGRDSRNPHRFKALLPAHLPCAALLDILARDPYGTTTDYWTRIHTPACTRRRRR